MRASGTRPGYMIATAACFCMLAGFLVYNAFYLDSALGDELFYLTIPQRLLKGDRLLIDETEVSQLSSVFLLLPYWLFTRVSGGNAGVVLFMRLLFGAVDLTFFILCIFRLKEKRLAGLIAATIFCADQFLGMQCLNYYSMACHALLLSAMILFDGNRRPGSPLLPFSGFLFACAVLNQPSLILVFFIFSAAVTIRAVSSRRRKKTFRDFDFFLNAKTYLLFSAGAAACAAVFFGYLLYSGVIRDLPANIAGLFSTGEYHSSAFGFFTVVNKPEIILRVYGIFPVAAMAVSCAAAAASRFVKLPGSTAAALKKLVFFSACAVCAVCYAVVLYKCSYRAFQQGVAEDRIAETFTEFAFAICSCSSVPLMFFAVTLYLLAEKHTPGVSALLAATLLCSAAVDPVSNASFLFGGRLAVFPAAFYTDVFLREAFPKGPAADRDGSAKTKRNTGRLAACAALCIVLAAETAFITMQTGSSTGFLNRKKTETANDRSKTVYSMIESGPYKGLMKPDDFAASLTALDRDLDRIRATGGPLYVYDLFPYIYLYCDLPFGTNTTYFAEDDDPARIVDYWSNHPSALPKCVFIPKVDDYRLQHDRTKEEIRAKIGYLSAYCSFDVTEMNSGILLTVNAWDLPDGDIPTTDLPE